MEEIRNMHFKGERALFQLRNSVLENVVFSEGESPLKESEQLLLKHCFFEWRYPVWYAKDIDILDGVFYEGARAGLWYCDRVSLQNTLISAPKCIRRCRDLTLRNVTIPHAEETLWECDGVRAEAVMVKGEYFAMNSRNLAFDGLTLDGKYSFDGVRNVTIRNAKILTKDAFWNSENVTVYDSTVIGEYIGWNAKNLTFVNCTIESLQGLCYIENLVLKNCRLVNTTLALEYVTVDAEIEGRVDSIKNPLGGKICVDEIGELILDPSRVDPSKTEILCPNIKVITKESDR